MSQHYWSLEDFKYDLPEELIAQEPLPERTDSRLMVLRMGSLRHGKFSNICNLLAPGDLLVLNDTRVIKARLRAHKSTGGAAELLIERITSEFEAKCQISASRSPSIGQTLKLGDYDILVLDRNKEFYNVRFPVPVYDLLDRYGETPLPPYIRRGENETDSERYQTVFAQSRGAIAAPTAGLHFSRDLLAQIEGHGVQICALTLHVGAGTFQPVRESNLENHQMHSEYYEVPDACIEAIRERKGRLVAVGTTVVRSLESWAMTGRQRGETNLFITPGFHFKIVDALITNFHLPESTLLMLVSAFAGHERILGAYAEAVKRGYRFFSYGDAMFCERG